MLLIVHVRNHSGVELLAAADRWATLRRGRH